MSLSINAESSLKRWLRGNTWSMRRTADMERWLEFVDQYMVDHPGFFDAPMVRRVVWSLVGDKLRRSGVLSAELERRLRLAAALVDLRNRAKSLRPRRGISPTPGAVL